MNKLSVQLKILDSRIGSEFPIPAYATHGSAGLDLIACIDENLVLNPNRSELIHTGISIFLNNPDYVALIVPRSGLGVKHGIVLGNLVGVIDADYQGPLMVSLWNRSTQAFTISPGDRIAQLLITPVLQSNFDIIKEFSKTTKRGSGGLGHTDHN